MAITHLINLDNINNDLTADQKRIFDNVISEVIAIEERSLLKDVDYQENFLSLTGAAGTGKSYLTTKIIRYFAKNSDLLNYGVCVTAPTHKAVSILRDMFFNEDRGNRIRVTTIHSFLCIKPFIDYKTGEERFRVDNTKKEKPVASLLIVDESSMISTELFKYIVEAYQEGRINSVLFVGDEYQLLPVDNKGVDKNIIYTLKKSFKLDKVVRQAKDSNIIKAATELRERIEKKDYIDIFELLKKYESKEIEFIHNKDDFIADFTKNNKWYLEDKIIASYYNNSVDGFNNIVRSIFWKENGVDKPQQFMNGDYIKFKNLYALNDITLYVNEEIVVLESAELKYNDVLDINYWECKAVNKNDQQKFLVVAKESKSTFNKKLQHIKGLANKEKNYKIRKEIWHIYYTTRDTYANVQYVFASTIHKLQGSTYDSIYIDLFSILNNLNIGMDEKYRLAYVAITRARYNAKIFVSANNNEPIEQKNEVDLEEHNNKLNDALKNLFV
jgi:ATP-dependent exoDNAse (exonuclease V) alpha subunit